MLPDLTLGIGVSCTVTGALCALVAPNRLVARRIATLAVSVAAAVVGLGLLLNLPSPEPTATLLANFPWMSARVIAFAALCSGVMALTLSPLTQASRHDLSVVCVLIATAAAIPFTASSWALYAMPLIGFAALIAALREQPQGNEAIALLFLFIGCATALQVLSALTGFGLEITTSLWILTVLAAPPFHLWYFRLISVIPLNLFAGLVILQASILASCVMVIPVAAHQTLSLILAISACINAFLASVQRDGRRAAAHIVSSQLAISGFAEFSTESTAIVGGTFILLTVVTATTGFLLLLGALEARSGQRISLIRPHGCYDSWPRLANAFLVLALVSAGLPLTLGYVSSDLILRGAFAVKTGPTVLVLVATILNAIAMIKMYLYLFQGSGGQQQPSDLRPRELIATFGLLVAVFVFAFELIPN